MRYLALLAIGGLVAGSFYLDDPIGPVPGPPPAIHHSLYAVCPVEEGGGRTTELTTLSTVQGPVQLTLFHGGQTAGSIGVSIGASGSNVIPVVDVAAVGTVGGLVEIPTGDSAVASVMRGATSLTAESCASSTSAQTYLTGGVSADERSFVVHLMNPFAGEAVVDLTVTSEVGVESNDQFNAVIVPSRSSTLVDVSQITPGRERLSVRIDTTAGRVIAVGRQSGDGDTATWNAVEAATDWLVPAPTADQPARVLVGNPSSTDVEYQIDAYGPGGLEEAVVSDSIQPGGQAVIDLSTLREGVTQAVRVISTAPVVATLWSEGPTILGVTNGSALPAGRWLLAGSLHTGAESGRVVILNPGLEDAAIQIQPMRGGGAEKALQVPAESVIELVLERADGFLVEASVPVVVMLSSLGAGPGALTLGVPLADE